MRLRSTIVIAASLLFFLLSRADAELIVEHLGSTDPETEGWVFNTWTFVDTTLSGGTDSEANWRMEVNGSGRYQKALTLAQLQDPTGWTITARAKYNSG